MIMERVDIMESEFIAVFNSDGIIYYFTKVFINSRIGRTCSLK